MRAPLLVLLLAAAGTVQAQYYYTDSFASYNSGAWSYPNGSGLNFTGSGLTSDGSYWVDSLIAYNNGGNPGRHEVKATFSGLPGGAFWVSADLYLATSTSGNNGYKIAFKDGCFTVYELSFGSLYTLSTNCFSYAGATTVRAIKTANGIRVVIGSQVFFTPGNSYSGAPGVGLSGGAWGYAVTQVQLAAGDAVAPNNVTGLSGLGSPAQVNLLWTGASDNAGGSGLLRYNIYRNGALLASTTGTAYTDSAVSPGTAYTYLIKSEDYHANEASGASVIVSTGTSFGISDPHAPRQTGVRALGSYWGGLGENLDMRSGNLNFSLPLLKAQGRHGASIGLGLSYNSQNWRQKPNGVNDGVYQIGYDVGYGFGWQLQAGSIFAVFSPGGGPISHYLFTDSSGAEYRLDFNDGNGVWWSKQGVYIGYDAGNQKLRFTDGTFWDMGSMSALSEPDAGLRYPTRVTDSNGNYITLEYLPGINQGGSNSSARISWIQDVRSAPGNAYTFNYTTFSGELVPHLTSIAAALPTGENYTLAHTAVGLKDPFFGTARGNSRFLQSLTATGPGLVHNFEYDANGTVPAGELTRVMFPYKGELQWVHGPFTYPDGQQLREVNSRKLVKQLGAAATTYTLQYGSGASGVHASGLVKDPNGVSEKYWEFGTTSGSTAFGLVTAQKERVQGTGAVTRESTFTWLADARGNRYIGTSITTIDPGQSYAKQLKTEQGLSVEGNLLWSKAYDFAAVLRTHQEFTYLATTPYAQRFILNRQTASTLKNGAGTILASSAAVYDAYPGSALTPRAGLALHDTANYGTFMTVRGNRTSGGISGGYGTSSTYDITGFAMTSTNGSTTTTATPDAKNMVAQTITPNGDATKAMTAGFNSIFQVTNASGPNGASTSIGYDANARPTTTTGPNGMVTTFTYDDVNRVKTATTGPTAARWVKSYWDGFGRTIKEETGYSSTVVSKVDTEYDSCGCSPIGKMKRVSRPYVTASPSLWTVYNYDSQGRVTSVVLPDSAGATSYIYEGNTNKVTSPAGKWKKHEVDSAGNLVQVTEPNPAGGADFVTTYSYNERNLLTSVNMTRPTGTQTRTFAYDVNGKVLTATNPETGLVTNTYDSQTGLLQQKVDAKNNKVTYAYDTYKRVIGINRYEWVIPFGGGAGSWVERVEQKTVLAYDGNAEAGFDPVNLAGRLAYVETYAKRGGAAWNAPGGGNAWETMTFREMYSYSTAGLMAKKRLKVSGRYSAAYAVATDFLESSYTFDQEGKMLSQTYPAAHGLLDPTEMAGDTHTYGFDLMGRPKTMNSTAPSGFQTPWISDVSYNESSQPTAISTTNPQVNAETRVYNTLGQMTSLTSGSYRFEYDFSASANDGRITTQRSFAGNVQQESISYTYDSLNRLSNANGGSWTAAYGYDGFGNLQTVAPTGAGPSAMNVTVNPATNRVSGWTYDANGNVTAMPSFTGVYDVENRLLEATKNSSVLYGYGGDNRRIWESKRGTVNPGGDVIEEYLTYWSGQRIGKYKVRWNGTINSGPPDSFVFAKVEENLYFGGKPLKLGSPTAPEVNVSVDRLGSIRRVPKDYFPYGQENPSTTAGDKEKYGTYKHDAATDLSYADQRY